MQNNKKHIKLNQIFSKPPASRSPIRLRQQMLSPVGQRKISLTDQTQSNTNARILTERGTEKLSVLDNIIKNCSNASLCHNQDNKPAKYYLCENKQKKYCRKCAIQLISLGNKMIEIVELPPKPIKQHSNNKNLEVLNSLNLNIRQNQQRIQQDYRNLKEQQQNLLQYINLQKDNLMCYYQNLLKDVKQFKNRDLNRLNQYYQQSLEILATREKQLIDIMDNLQVMNGEIGAAKQILKYPSYQNRFLELTDKFKKQLVHMTKVVYKSISNSLRPECYKKHNLSNKQISCVHYPQDTQQFSFEKGLLEELKSFDQNFNHFSTEGQLKDSEIKLSPVFKKI